VQRENRSSTSSCTPFTTWGNEFVSCAVTHWNRRGGGEHRGRSYAVTPMKLTTNAVNLNRAVRRNQDRICRILKVSGFVRYAPFFHGVDGSARRRRGRARRRPARRRLEPTHRRPRPHRPRRNPGPARRRDTRRQLPTHRRRSLCDPGALPHVRRRHRACPHRPGDLWRRRPQGRRLRQRLRACCRRTRASITAPTVQAVSSPPIAATCCAHSSPPAAGMPPDHRQTGTFSLEWLDRHFEQTQLTGHDTTTIPDLLHHRVIGLNVLNAINEAVCVEIDQPGIW